MRWGGNGGMLGDAQGCITLQDKPGFRLILMPVRTPSRSNKEFEGLKILGRLEGKGNLTLARGAETILQSPTINSLSLADAMTELSSRIAGGALYKAD